MEALKTKTEHAFKNKLIYYLIGCITVMSITFIIYYKKLVDDYSEHAYMVSNAGTYIGNLEKDYRVGDVEVRTHLRSFYNTMFSFTADTYTSNTKYAKDHLIDYETGIYIERVLTESDLYNQMLRMNAQMLTILDSISKVDYSREPYKVTAYCHQYMVRGQEKSEVPFVNTMEIVATGIKRTDENPTGLQIRNWKNIKIEE